MRSPAPPLALLLVGLALAGCASSRSGHECGRASWYGLDGNRTANGEIANSRGMTAAHPSLPFGTKMRVKNMDNGRTVTVRINDRGPFAKGRVVDVTEAAAMRLGFRDAGVARVCLARS
ncbi:septal ring lytic transglycosylase RlpA family protein [Lutibaculum baratangense]|uniref:Endolytic peptidoglycan transglycosylase RlpA n=1 Tax=Lutibaculum baratangense AMV1 TaxID=631454 RepID=V4RHU9_9HYPH|nr:septal ring lytic transglycosylase RlpA family protein [Lutibaculum baratangense]ESR25706.1 Rare lipoprotein A precursor [Lutibaculum baratangense AMV1]